MNHTSQPGWYSFVSIRFDAMRKMQFSGRLDVRSKEGFCWQFYFHIGQLAWAGEKRSSHWQQVIGRHCPHLARESLIALNGSSGPPGYAALVTLSKSHQIDRQQAFNSVEGMAVDTLFELFQSSWDQPESEFLTCTTDPQDWLDVLPATLAVDELWQRVLQQWQAWQQAGLAVTSPNWAPLIEQPEALRASVSSGVYATLSRLIDGQRSLRDLACLLKQDPLPLTRSLLPFIQKGLIRLQEPRPADPKVGIRQPPVAKEPVPRLQAETKPFVTSVPFSSQLEAAAADLQPLIVCIDDSPIIAQLMAKILTGYRFLAIQDSLQVLPLLLEHKPDLIFLDLVMPIANGYEICAQIRRISQFKKTPILILTGNDGIVDRMRAKMAGSTDFLAKPINESQVLASVQKYLVTSWLPSDQPTLTKVIA